MFGRNDEADSAVEFRGVLAHANEFDRKVTASALELRKIPVDEAACKLARPVRAEIKENDTVVRINFRNRCTVFGYYTRFNEFVRNAVLV